MSIVNGIIVAPVSINDLQRTFGTSLNDLGSIIRSGFVNKWAKYKPVWSLDVNNLSVSRFAASYNGYNGRAANMPDNNPNHEDGDYGVACNKTFQGTNNSFMSHFSEYLDADWTYAYPLGGGYTDAWGHGNASPYRLADFEGYEHSATVPMYLATPNVTANASAVDSGRYANIGFNVVEGNDNYNSIGLENLTRGSLDLRRTKFCVVLVSQINSNNKAIYEHSEYILENDGSLTRGYFNISIDVLSNQYSNLFSVHGVNFYAFLKTYTDTNPIFTPLPNDGIHPRQGTITVRSNPAESGLGVEDVYVTADTDSVTSLTNFRPYADISEEQGGEYTLRNYNGDMVFAILFYNDSDSSVTIRRNMFNAEQVGNWSEILAPVPERMYVGADMNSAGSYNVSGSSVSQYTIGAHKYKWVTLVWSAILNGYYYNRTSKGSATEFVVSVNNGKTTILNDVLYIYHGDGGWAFEHL